MQRIAYIFFAVLAFAVLLLKAFIYYNLRFMTPDVAYQTMLILVSKKLSYQNLRFGWGIIQLFPLTTSTLGFPLKTVLLSYSLGLIIFQIVVFITLISLDKSYKFGIAWIVFNLISTLHSFFFTQSELPIAIGFVFLSAAIYSLKNKEWWHHAILYALLLFAFFTHMLSYFAWIFILPTLYFYEKRNRKTPSLNAVITAALLSSVLFIIKVKLLTFNSYDNGKIQSIDKLIENLYHSISNGNSLVLLHYIFISYYFLLIIPLLSILLLIIRKEWNFALLILAIPIAYLSLVLATYPDEITEFYLEVNLFPLAAFSAVVLIFILLESKYTKPFGSILLLLFLAERISAIDIKSEYYQKRVDAYLSILQKGNNNASKYFISIKNTPTALKRDTWGSAMETILFTSIEGSEYTKTLLVKDTTKDYWGINEPNFFVGEYYTKKHEELPSNYFKLKRGVYQELK